MAPLFDTVNIIIIVFLRVDTCAKFLLRKMLGYGKLGPLIGGSLCRMLVFREMPMSPVTIFTILKMYPIRPKG